MRCIINCDCGVCAVIFLAFLFFLNVKSINNWFFKDLNYLYPNIMISYTRTLNSGWKAGIESKLYFPLGSLMNNNNFDSAIISFGLKLCTK